MKVIINNQSSQPYLTILHLPNMWKLPISIPDIVTCKGGKSVGNHKSTLTLKLMGKTIWSPKHWYQRPYKRLTCHSKNFVKRSSPITSTVCNGSFNTPRSTTIGGSKGGVPDVHLPPPPMVPILSFWHTEFSKHSCLGSWRPPMGNPGSATDYCRYFNCLPKGRHSEAAHEKRLLCAQKCTWGGWVMKRWGGVCHVGVGWGGVGWVMKGWVGWVM